MANQNAEQNALATTTDSTEQGDLDNDFASVSPSSAEIEDDGDDTVQESAPRRSRNDDEEERELYIPPRGPQGELVEAIKPTGDDAPEKKEVPLGRPYEIVFIVRNTHGEDIEGITQRARDLIEGAEGAVDNVRTSDVRRFSYPINKEVEGSYVVLNARFKTASVLELDRFFKLEEGIIRHLIVREDV